MFWETSQYEILKINPWILALLLLWLIFWKGTALWKSARKNSPFWFVALLIINTLGILEILYIFVFSKMKFSGKKKIKTRRKRNN